MLAAMQYDPPASVDVGRWQGELDRIAPREEGLSWLLLVWQPGDAWQPVHRWMIYQMVPERFVRRTVMPSLLGPHPRVRGRYDGVRRRYIPDPRCMVDRTQWELFAEYGCYGRPYWVIQGSRGGHRRRFDWIEKVAVFLKTGLSPEEIEPRAPGDLPYAEPDQRTIELIAQKDLMEKYGQIVAFAQDNPGAFDSLERAYIDQIAGEMWQWLEGQCEGAIEELAPQTFRKAIDAAWDEMPVRDVDWARRSHEQHRQFVEERNIY